MKLRVVINKHNRHNLAKAILEAEEGDVLDIKPPTRKLEQNALFHAICAEASRQALFMNRKLLAEQWKVLFISGHAVATGEGSEMLPGIEKEFVNIRESSASMSVKRISSLIEYAMAWCANNDVQIHVPAGLGYEELNK